LCQIETTKQRARCFLPYKTQAAAEFEINRVNDLQKLGEFVHLNIPFEPGFLKNELPVLLYLSEELLVRLKDWFIFVRNLKNRFNKPPVKNFFSKLNNYDNIIEEISANIDDDEQIRDKASDELYNIRRHKRKIKNKIRETLNNLLINRSNLFTDTNIVERDGRYVLPVKRNFKKDVHGVVHSYSNSGETVFIEPIGITDDYAQFVELNEREKQEIEKILKKLTNIIRSRMHDIEQDIETIIDFDLLFAKARFAEDLNATIPIFSDHLNIVNGFHPILKRVNENVVKLNLKMNSKKRILLISGPNAGGKTVVLKTVGVIELMAKCGLFIPAEEGTTIPFYDDVYSDIGDEQSIESRLSTFAAHINQIKEALNGSENSLVLLDELMSQTSVEEGSALAAAIMEEFVQKKSTVLATTHNEDLKIFVSRRSDMINGGMEFTDRPTYRFILGVPQPSNALKLASNLGISKSVIENALRYIDKDKMSLNKLFEDLSKELKAVQEERQKLSVLIQDYESRFKELNAKKKKELEKLKTKYKKELIQAKRSVEKLIKELKKQGPKPEAVHEMRQFFNEKFHIDEVHERYYPQIGEIVRIRDLKRVGQVIEEQGDKFKVSLENIYYWVDSRDIESIKANN
jgi:DNA mismatch repair protein MutS2